jgi:hypothetical protein
MPLWVIQGVAKQMVVIAILTIARGGTIWTTWTVLPAYLSAMPLWVIQGVAKQMVVIAILSIARGRRVMRSGESICRMRRRNQ